MPQRIGVLGRVCVGGGLNVCVCVCVCVCACGSECLVRACVCVCVLRLTWGGTFEAYEP